MPVDPTTEEPPTDAWPKPDATVDVTVGGKQTSYTVVGYRTAEDDEDGPVAVLREGEGLVGLYRLIRDGDTARIEHHAHNRRTRYPDRRWKSRHRLEGYFEDAPTPTDETGAARAEVETDGGEAPQ
ncbi:MAG: hypothetical protein ACI9CA_002265 [Natronomonas sp.]|jgi:hypothetical protein